MSYRSSLFCGVAFATLATLGGVLVSRAEPAPKARGMVFAYAPDSTPLFGPKRFNAPGSGSTIYTERFLAVAGSAYLLKVENGAPDGTGRVNTGTIRLNSVAILSPSDFAGAPALLTRFVQLTASDTLKAELSAGSGQFITVSVLASPNARYPIHGPTLVTVQSGTQVTVNDDFTLPAGTSGPFRVHVVNGPDGSTRVSNATVTLNGTDVLTQNDINANIAAVERAVTLTSSNTVAIKVKQSSVGNRLSIRFTATDTTKPKITLTAPSQNALTGNTSITVSGSIDDKTVTAVTVNGASAPLNATGAFSVSAPLGNEGQNTLTITATDANGNRTDSTRTVIRDTQPPNFDVYHPIPDLVTPASSEFTRGPVSDLTAVTVTANGLAQALTGDGFFEDMVPLSPGVNQITFVATDVLGHASTVVRTVVRDNTAPSLAVTAPANNSSTTASSISVTGTATDATALGVTVNGDPVSVDEVGAFSTTVPLDEGANVITVVATDAAGNTSAVARNVTRETGPLPPDPSTVAPPVDRTVATTMAAATEFLYTGANSIQTGVVSGTIDPERIAVLRGTVKKRDGSALPGVQITVLDHPELGQTLTRADGAFDLAVNGGGLVTIAYSKTGFLPVQRQVNAPWQDYTSVDEAVMIPLDTAVTTVDFSTPMQVARGSTVTDADGTRRATVMFPQGTQATMVMPNGSTQPLTTMAVRATEYTVGEAGPKAMPGVLPPTSGYTYAVELSVDSAIATGAKSVEFDRPVPVYVENFLQLPVGLRVPVAFYDRARAAWIPMENGRIIKITATNGGIASISLDTSGTVADSATLAGLGITVAERQALATMYASGQSLWRMPVMHFSPIDGNYPFGPPGGALTPSLTQPQNDDTCAARVGGSLIECTTQVLGERLAVTGVPFDLTYRSNRARGFKAAYRQTVRLTGSSLPQNLRRVVVEIEVAGRKTVQSFDPAPNLSTNFAWDGRDAYGRLVQGTQPMTIRIGYVYPLLYNVPANEAATFGLTCYGSGSLSWSAACVIPRELGNVGLAARSETTLWQFTRLTIGTLDLEAEQEGLWSIDVHHVFDPVGRVLYLGDGSRRSAQDVMTTVAGTGAIGTSGDGGPALEATLDDPTGVAIGPDGSVFIADRSNKIRRVLPNGVLTVFAGGGSGPPGDGGPATQASLGPLGSLAVGPDGSVYFGQRLDGVIRRISPDGIINRVAGDRAIAFCIPDEQPSEDIEQRAACLNDGGSALAASIWGPEAIAVGPDGSVYFADGNYVVRKVNPNGIITTIAGGAFAAQPCHYGGDAPWPGTACGDGGPARYAGLGLVEGIAAGPDGSVYVFDTGNRAVRRIGPDGIINRVAGDGSGIGGYSGDGGPATNARIYGYEAGLAVGPDGSLYIAQYHLVRRVKDGIITTVAGTDALASACGGTNQPKCRSDDPATQTPINIMRFSGLAAGPDGSVYFPTADGDYRVRRVVPFFQPFSGDAITIASEDGSELYEFDARGRHLRTRDALTKRVLLTFAYDGAGRVTSVTDADGNVSTLERDASGRLTAIVSPFGKRTTLTFDQNGYLATLTNPANEVVTVVHDSLGLLRSLRDAKNNPPQQFAYDSLGRLVQDTYPEGGFKTLTRSETDTSVTAAVTTAMGRTETYTRLGLRTGTIRRVETDAAGLRTQRDEFTNGTSIIAPPDGSVTTITEQAGPRFGMQAPVTSTFSVRMPSGLQLSGASIRKATLANPNDPLSLTSQTDSLVVNGRSFKSLFDAAARTLTKTSAEGRQAVTQLDALGRVVEERVVGVAPVRYGYGPRGFLTTVTQAARVLRYDYDSSGRVRKVTDPLGRFEQYAYDSVGRVVKQTLFNGREILYGYDANGNLTSLTPPGRPAHTFAYTAGNLDSVYSPPAAGLPVSATKYAFNLDRQLTRVLRPDSLAIDVAYDTAGRPSMLTLPNGQVQFAYSPTSGNLTTLTAPDGGTLSYTYDGSLPRTVTWGGAVQGSVGFKYDSDFRVSKIAVNGTDSISFGYDRDNLLTSAGAMTLTRDAQNGRLVRTVLGSDTSTWTYDDSTGVVTHYAAKHGATTLFDALYTRDSLDRIVELEETVGSVTTVKAFTYDSVGRLDQVRINGALTSDYDYDANGNRTSLTTQSGTVTGTYDDQDRMLTYGASTFVYMANGELRKRTVGGDTTQYTYDLLGSLLQVGHPNGTAIQYLVDARNRRIGKKVNGALVQGFLFQGQLAPVAELDGTGQVVSRFIYGTRPNVPEYMLKGGVTYRLVTDDRGSVRLVVNTATGQVAQRVDYDEFGQVTVNTSPGFQPFGFAGGLWDWDTKLVRFGDRDYDAETGRWLSKDQAVFGGGSSNLYSYALEDPVNLVDHDGRQALVGAAIGAGGDLLYQLYRNDWDWACVNWWEVGEWGFLGSGAGMLRRASMTGLRRLLYDSRPFKMISREYWATRGGASGMSLDHWWFSQAAARSGAVSEGVANAGWNLIEMPASWNRWLGFAPRWRGVQGTLAQAARVAVQRGIPAAAATGALAGYEIGTRAQAQGTCGCR